MSNAFYSATGSPGTHGPLSSAQIRAEFSAIAAAFDKMPLFAGNGGKLVRVNAGMTGLEVDPSTYLTSAAGNAAYLALVGGTLSGGVLSNAGEALRIANDAGYVSFFNSANDTRRGLLALVGSAVTLAAEGPDYLSLATSGIEAMRIDTGRNVGIGGPSPGARLFVSGPTSAIGVLNSDATTGGAVELRTLGSNIGYLGAAGATVTGGTATDIALRYKNNLLISKDGATTAIFDASGNFGLNVVGSALNRFQVRHQANINLGVTGGNVDANAIMLNAFNDAGAQIGMEYRGTQFIWNSAGVERLRLDSSGNVGINIATPGAKLDIESSTSGAATLKAVNTGAAASPVGYFTNGADSDFVIYLSGVGATPKSATIGPSTATPLVFQTGAGERMRLDASGRLGIGTAAATYPLQVVNVGTVASGNWTNLAAFQDASLNKGIAVGFDSTSQTGIIAPLTSSANSDLAVWCYNATLGGWGERFRVTSTGNVFDGAALELGYKDIPPSTLADNAVLGVSSRGKCVVGAFSNLTVNTGIFKRGDSMAVYQDGSTAMFINQGSGMTLRLAGSTTTGTRTIAARGYATLWFNSATECIVSGAGVS